MLAVSVDDASPLVVYSPSTPSNSFPHESPSLGWISKFNGQFLQKTGEVGIDNSSHVTNLVGANFTLDFIGSGIALAGSSNAASWEIYLDGTAAPVSQYNDTRTLFTISNLTESSHSVTLRVQSASSPSSFVSFDEAIIDSSGSLNTTSTFVPVDSEFQTTSDWRSIKVSTPLSLSLNGGTTFRNVSTWMASSTAGDSMSLNLPMSYLSAAPQKRHHSTSRSKSSQYSTLSALRLIGIVSPSSGLYQVTLTSGSNSSQTFSQTFNASSAWSSLGELFVVENIHKRLGMSSKEMSSNGTITLTVQNLENRQLGVVGIETVTAFIAQRNVSSSLHNLSHKSKSDSPRILTGILVGVTAISVAMAILAAIALYFAIRTCKRRKRRAASLNAERDDEKGPMEVVGDGAEITVGPNIGNPKHPLPPAPVIHTSATSSLIFEIGHTSRRDTSSNNNVDNRGDTPTSHDRHRIKTITSSDVALRVSVAGSLGFAQDVERALIFERGSRESSRQDQGQNHDRGFISQDNAQASGSRDSRHLYLTNPDAKRDTISTFLDMDDVARISQSNSSNSRSSTGGRMEASGSGNPNIRFVTRPPPIHVNSPTASQQSISQGSSLRTSGPIRISQMTQASNPVDLYSGLVHEREDEQRGEDEVQEPLSAGHPYATSPPPDYTPNLRRHHNQSQIRSQTQTSNHDRSRTLHHRAQSAAALDGLVRESFIDFEMVHPSSPLPRRIREGGRDIRESGVSDFPTTPISQMGFSAPRNRPFSDSGDLGIGQAM